MEINIYLYTYATKKVPSVFNSQTEALAPDLLNC